MVVSLLFFLDKKRSKKVKIGTRNLTAAQICLCTIPFVKDPKRRSLWTSVYFGILELTSFGFGSLFFKKKIEKLLTIRNSP